MPKIFEEQEVGKYKKRSKKKGLKKSKHKHQYEPCLCHCIDTIPSIKEPSGKLYIDSYFYAERCSICGRLNNKKVFETKRDGYNSSYSVLLTNEEIKEKYKHLEIVEVQSYFTEFVEI